MPTYCCVPQCSQLGVRKETNGKTIKVSFHQFPSDSNIKKLWIRNIRRDIGKHFSLHPQTKVCSLHFTADDYWPNVTNRKLLKPTAVPSVFAWNEKNLTKGERRNRKRKNESLINDTTTEYEVTGNEDERDPSNAIGNEEVRDKLNSNSVKEGIDEFNSTSMEERGSPNANGNEEVKENLYATGIEGETSNANRNVEGKDQLNATSMEEEETLNAISNEEGKDQSNISVYENETITELKLKLEYMQEQLEDKNKTISELKTTIDHLNNEIFSLKGSCLTNEVSIKLLKKGNEDLNTQLQRTSITLEKLQDNDENISFYTGIPSYGKLMALYNFLNPGDNGENIKMWYSSRKNSWKENKKVNNIPVSSNRGRKRKLPPKTQFLLTMMKLRLGLFQKDLAHRFGISQSTVSKIFITWINFMYLQLGQICILPSREYIDQYMPPEFQEHYPTTRVILDATEIKCETPQSLVIQSGTYSNYKSTNLDRNVIPTD